MTPSTIQFACPTCKTTLQAQPQHAGATIACPKCKGQMKVPAPAVASVSQPRSSDTPPHHAGPPTPAATKGAAERKWYYIRNGQKCGPVSADDLAQLAITGKLRATDLVWTTGLQEWVPASTVEDLPFSSGQVPPPVPSLTANALDDPVSSAKGLALRLWENKRAFWMTVATAMYLLLFVGTIFLGADGCALAFILTLLYVGGVVAVFAVTRSPAAKLVGKWESKATGNLPALVIEFLKDGTDSSPIFGSATRTTHGTYRLHEDKSLEITLTNPARKLTERVVFFPTWDKPYDLVLTFEGEARALKQYNPVSKSVASWFSTEEDKREYLFGRWEPLDGQGAAIQFSKDGAFLRAGGFVAKYRLGPEDTIEVYADDSSAVLTLKVVSLSKHELAFRADGQGYHYKRAMSFTEAVEQQQWEKTKETMKTVAKGAGVAAAGAVLALGAAAVFAAAASTPTYCYCGYPRRAGYFCQRCGL